MRRAPRPYAGDPSLRGVRRLALVQCTVCSAKGSALVVGGRLRAVDSNLPAVEKTTGWFHVPCKRGRLELFDLGGSRA